MQGMENHVTFNKRNIQSSRPTPQKFVQLPRDWESASSSTNGSSDINDLLASVTDVNRRLQNVDIVNKKLRQQKQEMSKELNVQKEQLSSLFQENCGLQEKAALLDIENKNLKQEKQQLCEEKKQLQSKLQDFEQRHKECNISLQLRRDSGGNSGVGIRNSAPAGIPALEKIRVLEKRHSSPQFFPSNENSSNSRESLGGSKDVTMDLQRQMMEKQKLSSSQPNSLLQSEYSLLGIVVPEEQMLQDVNNCLENMSSIKRDADFVNHNLKYLMHACFNARISAPRKEGGQMKNESILVSRGGGDEGHGSTDFVSSNSETRTCVDSLENICPETIGRMSYMKEDLEKLRLDDVSSQYEAPRVQLMGPDFRYDQRRQQNDATQGFIQPRQLNWPEASFLPPYCDVQPTMLRSVSSEVVVSSPPPSSSLLSPDSLASLGQPNWASPRENDQYLKLDVAGLATAASPDVEERKCPVCYAVFPETVSQKDFEAHVLMHWDMEEYELINSQ